MTKQTEAKLATNVRQKAGHYEVLGETYAKFELFENGWNPYSRFLDVDKVDLILRRRDTERAIYREVQVKYGKLYEVGQKWEQPLFDVTSWRFFREGEFDNHLNYSHFFVVYVLAADAGYRGDIFIFPVRDFVSLLRSAIPSKDKRKVCISRLKGQPEKWVLRRVSKFSGIDDFTTMDVSRFRRNFKLLMG
jgi:hypothetical protein